MEELKKWTKPGVRIVKWLPNAHGMNAADPRNDDCYRMLRKYDITLLTHVGEEQAAAGAEYQAFGNPLLLMSKYFRLSTRALLMMAVATPGSYLSLALADGTDDA